MTMGWTTRSLRRARSWLWIPAVAAPLVIVLGVLQFRWLTQLSEHERESRQARLIADTDRFGEDFDRELAHVYSAFQLNAAAAVEQGDGRDVVARYELWKKRTAHPRLIRDIWIAIGGSSRFAMQSGSVNMSAGDMLVTEMGGDPRSAAPWRLLHLDTAKRSLVAAKASPALEDLRSRLGAPPSQADKHGPFWGPIDEGTLSILIPIVDRVPMVEVPPEAARSSEAFAGALQVAEPTMRFAIVQLDRDYIIGELLPALAQRYFSGAPSSRELQYQVVVVRSRAPHTVVYVSHPQKNGHLPATVDATGSLLGIRFSMVFNGSTAFTTILLDVPDQAGGKSVAPTTGVLAGADGNTPEFWQLRVTHRAGSLEALAALARYQNLIASLTILALLAGSLVLMLVALRRARALTRQQMEFVAGISHELRTPVAVVCMTGANLADGLVSDPEQVRHYGRLIQREGRRLTEMTEQVLSFARVESIAHPVFEPVAIDALISHVVAVMQPQLDERGFKCSMSLDSSLAPLVVDRASLERAIQNLISNALQYSMERREIRITAGTDAWRAGMAVWIAVEDYGIGIFPDELSLIFEPFRRGRGAIERNLPGTGLGLSLVRRIMQAHGGDVQVRSEPGAGSTFTLFFPTADGVRPEAHQEA